MKSIKLKDLEKLIIEKYSEDEKFKEFLKENRDLEVEVAVENIKLKELEKSIKLKDLEKLIIEKYSEDEKFKEFLKENRDLEVEVAVENIKLKELEDMEEFTEETVIDYLDEIANLEVISEEKEKEQLKNIEDSEEIVIKYLGDYLDEIANLEVISEEKEKEQLKNIEDSEEIVIKYLGEVASIAFNYIREGIAYMDIVQEGTVGLMKAISFNYIREGIAYMDIVQEGTVGLMKAISNYDVEEDGEFKNYCRFWIIKEMVMFIQNKVEDIKYEFMNYFKTKKENFGKEHHHEHEEEHEHGEVYLKEEDLLPILEKNIIMSMKRSMNMERFI